jgi:hypothetical protein
LIATVSCSKLVEKVVFVGGGGQLDGGAGGRQGPHLPGCCTELYGKQEIHLHAHLLKGLCHEIFGLCFFRQSIMRRPQINTLKYFEF